MRAKSSKASVSPRTVGKIFAAAKQASASSRDRFSDACRLFLIVFRRMANAARATRKKSAWEGTATGGSFRIRSTIKEESTLGRGVKHAAGTRAASLTSA